MRGPIGFQVPIDSGPLQFVYSPSFGSGRVVIDLGEI
jgi:hypothetical protein